MTPFESAFAWLLPWMAVAAPGEAVVEPSAGALVQVDAGSGAPSSIGAPSSAILEGSCAPELRASNGARAFERLRQSLPSGPLTQQDDALPPGDDDDSDDLPPPLDECIAVEPFAVFRGFGYDHIVRLSSSCDADRECSVVTDVNPSAILVIVPAGDVIDVLTFRGSPSSVFHAYVQCPPRS